MSRSKLLPYLLLLPSIIVVCAVIIYPICYGVYLSITDQSLIGREAHIVGLRNFVNLYKDEVFRRVIVNAALWSIYTVVGVMVLGLGLALLLNRDFVGRTFARGILLVPWTVPTTALAIIFAWLYDPMMGTVNQIVMALGGPRLSLLSDTSTALAWVALPVIWRFCPFVMLMLLAELQSIDKDLYDAAGVDGAGSLQKFWSITLPIMRPTISLVAILQFIWIFNHVDMIWVLTRGGPANATHILSTYAFYYSYKRWEYGYASAVGVLMLAVLFVSAAMYLRREGRSEAK